MTSLHLFALTASRRPNYFFNPAFANTGPWSRAPTRSMSELQLPPFFFPCPPPPTQTCWLCWTGLSGPGVWRPSGPRMCFHPSQGWGGLTGLHEWEVLYCWGHRHGTVLDPTIICGDWPLPVWSVHFRPASLSQRFTHAFPISGSPRMRSDWPQNISCPRADWHTHTHTENRAVNLQDRFLFQIEAAKQMRKVASRLWTKSLPSSLPHPPHNQTFSFFLRKDWSIKLAFFCFFLRLLFPQLSLSVNRFPWHELNLAAYWFNVE